MPVYRLFHLDHPNEPMAPSSSAMEARFQAMMGRVEEAVRLGLYREVARVQSPDIHQLFPLTNHIDADWTEGANILAVSTPARSTSVGDIAMDEETGQLSACAAYGWDGLDAEYSGMFRDHLGTAIPELPAPASPDLTP